MAVELSIVVPLHNEEGNVARLVGEIADALAGREFELLLVDDGSTDRTLAEALRLGSTVPQLRVLQRPSRLGQSAAIWCGVEAARASWIVTLDGDCQNDPRDIGGLLAARDAERDESVRLVVGHRTTRRDSRWRRFQSRVANAVRGTLLGDRTPDTGCGLKLFARDTFLALPRFDHMHRFLPALFIREGARVLSVPVHHRPRAAGRSKYGMLERLAAGLIDLGGVLWLMHRGWPERVEREVADSRSGSAARAVRAALTLVAVAVSCVLAAGEAPTAEAQPIKPCHLRLIVKFSPEVPNPRDPQFLSSFTGTPGFRLIWRGHSDMSQTLELVGPGPAYRCMREVDRMRNDARALNIRIAGG